MKTIPYIDEKYPELINYFSSKEEAHLPLYSTQKIIVRCPLCEKEYETIPRKLALNKNHACPFCSDGFSYPEKFMYNVLSEMNIEFAYHYYDKWTKPYIYDFMFVYNDTKYIIEMDGGLGHGNNSIGKRSAELTRQIDLTKDELAKNNGYTLLRIDCNYKGEDRFTYIKTNVIETLDDVLDISNVDFDKCNYNSLSSKFLEVIDCYNNKSKFVNDISSITRVKQRTIKKYLFSAMKNGIIPKNTIITNNPGVSNFIGNDGVSLCGKSVYCYEDDKFFYRIRDCANYYKFHEGSFSAALRSGDIAYYHKKHFCYADKKDSNENIEHKFFKSDNIYQYSLDGQLLNVYHGKNELPENYKYPSIVKGCTGKRKTVYGYKWSYTMLTCGAF